MKFLIVTKHGTRIEEAEDIAVAADKSFDNHTGFKDVIAVVRMPDDELSD